MFKKKPSIYSRLIAPNNVMYKSGVGFTLVEIISTIFISIVILMIVFIAYVSYNRLYATESNLADAERNNTLIMHSLTNEIRAAKIILSNKTVNGSLYTTGTSTIVLEYPVFDSGNNLISAVSDYGAVYLDPINTGNLMLSIEANVNSSRTTGTRVLGNYAESLLLRYNAINPAEASNITVFLTTRSADLPRGESSVTKTNSISLRND